MYLQWRLHSQGLQWGTSEKLAPFAPSFAIARMMIIPIIVVTMFHISIVRRNRENIRTRRVLVIVDINAETKR
jgi:hypothetical protein